MVKAISPPFPVIFHLFNTSLSSFTDNYKHIATEIDGGFCMTVDMKSRFHFAALPSQKRPCILSLLFLDLHHCLSPLCALLQRTPQGFPVCD